MYDLQSKEIEKIYDAFNLNGLLIDFEENTIRVVRELQKIKWFWNGKSAPTVSHCGYNNLKFDCALFEEICDWFEKTRKKVTCNTCLSMLDSIIFF